MRCSAEGCSFQSNEIAPGSQGPDHRPFCGYHVMGRETSSREIFLRVPCVCGRVAAGFDRVAGGFSARHTERICLERTIQASPDDPTVPANLPNSKAPPIEPPRVAHTQRCACGKRTDGATNAAGRFIESHSTRECIEQTTR
jgi:hypothetical protein